MAFRLRLCSAGGVKKTASKHSKIMNVSGFQCFVVIGPTVRPRIRKLSGESLAKDQSGVRRIVRAPSALESSKSNNPPRANTSASPSAPFHINWFAIFAHIEREKALETSTQQSSALWRESSREHHGLMDRRDSVWTTSSDVHVPQAPSSTLGSILFAHAQRRRPASQVRPRPSAMVRVRQFPNPRRMSGIAA
jgi:hypothetical protein